MEHNQVSIFDLRERVLFTDATLQLGAKALKSIDYETVQTRKHSTHAESALRFIFLDLNATKTKDELIADRQLQRELRKKLFKRKEGSYQYLTNFAKHYS